MFLSRAKDLDETITEFRLLAEDKELTGNQAQSRSAKGKYSVVKGDSELVKHLDGGWSLIQSLSDDKFLMKI